MDTESWNRLSEWHNAWLEASVDEQEPLQRQFVIENPALASDANALSDTGPIAPGFLETPALAFALDDLAADAEPLAAGTHLGPYRIVGLIARGGMGHVYRATDVRLGRDVALKVLSHTGTDIESRIDRFIQEGRVVASLDCPNIVCLFDVGVHAQWPFLVMELLDGETLRARIARGALSADDAGRIALETARGLAAAHAAGLVHRDLKPENVFLTRAGVTKILDFGVAKLVPEVLTRTDPITLSQTLIGTAGYLAPEQLLGRTADGRADLFALGAVLFEMLTGRRAFGRAHTIDTLHAVLHEPVPSLLDETPSVPPQMSTVVQRLLEKEPGGRFQTASDLAWALEQPAYAPINRTAPQPGSRHGAATWRWTTLAAGIAIVGVVSGAWWMLRPDVEAPVPRPLAQFVWELPSGMALGSELAVSPDGQRIAFAGSDASGTRLLVRDLSSIDAMPIPGTEGAKQPFWSPDSQSIGFFAKGKLVRVAIDGGAPVVLADAPDGHGGSWSSSGTIVFQPRLRDSGLARVRAGGGRVEPATQLDVPADDTAHRWPAFLPDGIHFLYLVLSTDEERRGIYVGSLAGEATRPAAQLFRSESGAIYARRPGERHGVLLTATNGLIKGWVFDTERLAVLGDARTLPFAAASATPHHGAMLSVSTDALAFASTAVPYGMNVAVSSRSGDDVRILSEPELGGFLRLAPDGRRLVRTRVDPWASNPDLWVEDLERRTLVRVTTGPDFDVVPAWSPDGMTVAYRSGVTDRSNISFAAADGTGISSVLPCPGRVCEPTDWSADGRSLIVTVAGADIWMVPIDPKDSPRPLLDGSFVERDARLSPDGRWIAYVSDETGRPEVSVRSLNGPVRRVVVSSGGGDQPVWRRDGTELFHVDGAGVLVAVPVRFDREGGPAFGRSTRVNLPPFGERHWGTEYDVSPDGTHVYFPKRPDREAPREMRIVLGWSALLK